MTDMFAVPVGIENFEQVIRNNLYYVDKTLYIKRIISENIALCTCVESCVEDPFIRRSIL